MARPEYATIRELPDYAVTNTWEIQLTPPSRLSINSEKLNAVASNVSPRPTYSNTALTTNIRGVKINQPGDNTIASDTIGITILETVDKQWGTVIKQWFDLCQNYKTKYAAPRKDVMGTLIITELNRQNEPVYRYTLQDVFLTSVSMPDFGSDQQLQEYTMTLTYNFFDEENI